MSCLFLRLVLVMTLRARLGNDGRAQTDDQHDKGVFVAEGGVWGEMGK